ncbi:molybdenum cofactor guanylyltransferase [Chloroflexota bacterium]
MDVSCIVLAGGRASRLGHNKAQVRIGNKTLFQRVLCGISFIKGEVIVVSGGKESFPILSSESRERLVTDIYPRKGPLVGIFTGLRVSRSQHNLVVACDMPFLNRGLLSYMIELATGFDLVIPRLGDMVEPLHAVYSRDCLAAIERMIEQDNLGVNRLLSRVRVRYVEADEIDRFDPAHLSFFNINTEADLKAAREIDSCRDIVSDQC